ncbi:MAG TPA: amidohydrolase family protein, partial [Reyranella sp.]
TLEGGVTAVRDCGGKDYIEFAVRDAYNQGRFLGPTMRCAGRMICMTGGHGNRTGRIADGVDEVVKAVREQVHAGSDLIKIMATGGVMTPGVNPEDAHYSAEEMKAGITEGHRFGKCCASHAQGALGILNAVRGGIDSIEHGIFMTDECIREMKERGVWLVPTLAAVKNILKGYDDGDRSIPDYVIEKARRVFDRHIASIKMYYKAGGKIAMGTDAGTPHNRHGENAKELEFMCEIGISTRDSLFFSTASAADLMRIDEGRIKQGNSADFVLCDGDPLTDIKRAARKENHRLVVKRGQVAKDRRADFAHSAQRVAAE